MRRVWERYRKGMGKVWERYGKGMGKWKVMGKTWERYDPDPDPSLKLHI